MGKYLICTERKCWHFENTKTIILSNIIKTQNDPSLKYPIGIKFQKTSQQVIGRYVHSIGKSIQTFFVFSKKISKGREIIGIIFFHSYFPLLQTLDTLAKKYLA